MNQRENILIDAVQKGRRDKDSSDQGGKEPDRSGTEYDWKRCGTYLVFRIALRSRKDVVIVTI
jgi:hypothetical protein